MFFQKSDPKGSGNFLHQQSIVTAPAYSITPNQISFGKLKLPYVHLNDVPCAYCNKPMISLKAFNSIKWPKENKNLASYHLKLIKTLEPFKSYMHDVEADVFEEIKKLNHQYPQKTFQQLLELIRVNHLQLLEAEQIKVLNQLNEMVDDLVFGLSENNKKSIETNSLIVFAETKKLISSTIDIIKHSQEDRHFLRKVFFVKLGQLIKQNPNNTLLRRVNEKAKALPSSRDNKSAFIVKYSGKAPVNKGHPRYKTSQEIAYNLIYSAEMTLDHMIPKSSSKMLKNNLDNALGACAHCNNNIKGGMSFRQFISKEGIVDNIKKHFQYLIKNVNSLENGNSYIKNLSTTLERITKGIIKIDTSELKNIN
jgi:hypothetical protein